jgi:hypothetical protein
MLDFGGGAGVRGDVAEGLRRGVPRGQAVALAGASKPGRRTHPGAKRQNIFVPMFGAAGVETVLTELPGNKKAAGAAQ